MQLQRCLPQFRSKTYFFDTSDQFEAVRIRLINSDYCFRYVVTNDGRSSDLQVWSLGEDSGESNLTEENKLSTREVKLHTC